MQCMYVRKKKKVRESEKSQIDTYIYTYIRSYIHSHIHMHRAM